MRPIITLKFKGDNYSTRILFSITTFVYLCFIATYVSFYPLWDGYYYFYILREAITNTKNLSDFIGMYNLNSHPSMGYTTYASLGQLFFFNNQYVLHYQNIFLNLVAGYCFLYILIYFIGEKNKLDAVLISTIYLFHPLNNATLLNFNLDYPILIFFTTLVYSYLYKKDILVVLSGSLLVFSKESGIILYLSFVAALYIPAIITRLTTAQIKPIRNKRCYILPILFLGLYFLVRYFFAQPLLFSANGYGSFINIVKELFEPDLKITWARLLQIFVLNFNWVISATVVLYLIRLLSIRKLPHFEKTGGQSSHLMIVLLIFSSYVYTSIFLFKAAVHPRYIVVSLFFLLLFFAKAIVEIISNRIIRVVFICIYLLFVVQQNFKSVDWVSNKLFGTYNFGTHKIVKTDALIINPYGHGPRDLMAYNLEYTVIDKLVNKLYKTINIDENSFIITERMDHPSLHPKFRNQNIQPNVIILDELQQHIKDFNSITRVYYVHIAQPHDPKIGLNIVKANFDIAEEYEIGLDGYLITAYRLQPLSRLIDGGATPVL